MKLHKTLKVSDAEGTTKRRIDESVKGIAEAIINLLALPLPEWLLSSNAPTMGAIRIFTPSSEQMIKMYIVDNVVEYVEGNNNVKELPDKVVEACNKLLDDYIADKE